MKYFIYITKKINSDLKSFSPVPKCFCTNRIYISFLNSEMEFPAHDMISQPCIISLWL